MMLVAVVAVAPIALLSGQRLDPGGLDAWGWIVVLAIGSGGVGHLLVNWAHDHRPDRHVAAHPRHPGGRVAQRGDLPRPRPQPSC
ncbi:MAG TPA: hypothetical protein VGZ52_07730 [Acidimicrobiales bacterium]|nr:hypothetical protein [Acidimicrobiales bacterium]